MNNQIDSKLTSIEDIEAQLRKKPEYRKAERKVRLFLNIASDIIRNRTQKGLTQTELAEAAGTHQSRISKIESGDQDLRVSTLIKIAEALDCEIYFSFCALEDFSYYDNLHSYEDLFEAQTQPLLTESKENLTNYVESPQVDFQDVSL